MGDFAKHEGFMVLPLTPSPAFHVWFPCPSLYDPLVLRYVTLLVVPLGVSIHDWLGSMS